MLRSWLMAFRPKTLTAAVVPIVVATALVRGVEFRGSHWPVSYWISFCALMGAIMIQIGTNLFNDALDFEKGADDEKRMGPTRVTQSGLLSAKSVKIMALGSFIAAMAFGLPLVVQGGWVILIIGLVSLVCGYAYTGGPFPLAYRGAGDLFVVLFFGLVAVGGVFFLHTGSYSLAAAVAGLQIGFLSTVLIAINNLRDAIGDAKVNKKTLAVRFGPGFVRFEILFLILSSFVLGVYWIKEGRIWAFVLPLLVFPLGLRLVQGIYVEPPGPVYNNFLARAAGLHLIFGVLLSLGFLVG